MLCNLLMLYVHIVILLKCIKHLIYKVPNIMKDEIFYIIFYFYDTLVN